MTKTKAKKKAVPKASPKAVLPSPLDGTVIDFSLFPLSCPGLLDKVLALDPRRVDPSLVWALLTDFKGYGGAKACGDYIPFLIQVALLDDLVNTVLPASVPGGGGSHRLVLMPMTYQEVGKTRYATVNVMLEDVPQLLGLPCLVRAEMGLPGIETPLTPREGIKPAAFPFGGWSPTTPVVGTIDHGIAFLHRHFSVAAGASSSAWMSRIVRLWDQWTGLVDHPAPKPPLPPWRKNDAFGYGRYFDAADIAPYLDLPGDELARYAALDYAPASRPASHGTHVLDVAAGPFNRGLAAGMQMLAAPEPAASLPLIAVQLPWLPEKDVSGASLCVHVLDAMRFILDSTTRETRDQPFRDVVVNLSDGALCGSHNAGSTIEAAIDELLVDNPRLSLVIAAGNAYEMSTHVRGTIGPSPAKVALVWQLRPDDRTESFMEVWFPDATDVDATVESPQGDQALALSVGQVSAWRPGGVEILAGAVYVSQAPTGTGQLLRISLRPTRPPIPEDGAAPHGLWKVVLKNRETHSVSFDAWIQRDDPPFAEDGPRRQAVFLAGATQGIAGTNTLNSLGTGECPIVVGGYRLNDSGLARYSSAGGPLDLSKLPTVVAPSDEGPVGQGLRAAGNRSGSTVRMNGTSVAAPGVTRAIANALAAKPTVPLASDVVKKAVRAAAQVRAAPSEPEVPSASTDLPRRVGSGWLDPTAVIVIP